MPFKNFNQAINAKVKVTTVLDQSITGHIYSISASNEVLALRTPNNNHTQNSSKKHPSKADSYRIINTAFIKSIQVLQPHVKKGSNNLQQKPSTADLEKSLNDAVRMIKSTRAS